MYRLQQQVPEIERLGVHHFTYQCWRAGSLLELGVWTRTSHIARAESRRKIREHAVGYLPAEKLWFRPKKDCVAVMFWYEDGYFWTHLTCEEFSICFP